MVVDRFINLFRHWNPTKESASDLLVRAGKSIMNGLQIKDGDDLLNETIDAIGNTAIDFVSMVTPFRQILLRKLERDGKIVSEDQIEQLSKQLQELAEEYHDWEITEAESAGGGNFNPAGSAYRSVVLGDQQRQKAARSANARNKAAAEEANQRVSAKRKEISEAYDKAVADRNSAEANLFGTLRET